ncbi:translocation/assembly module TamB domain-containing protein [Candidatus Cardinium hertigii]|uniref:translocation/assembly module TamB domain-containing protein n=1 Tax=Candidatus Cardinium hertigii TaxID=247481 RepID=UPI003D7D6157
MKKIKKSFNKIKKWFLKPVKRLLYGLTVLVATVMALCHIPVVQQQLLGKLLNYFHQTTHYRITCDQFRLTWFRQLTLVGVTVRDPQHNPLFSIDGCKGQLNLLDLLLLKPNMIHSISIEGGAVYLEKNKGQPFNMVTFYDKAILPFVPVSDRAICIHKLELHGLNLYYHNQINRQKISVTHIDVSINDFKSVSDHYSGSLTTLSYQTTDVLPLVLKKMMAQFTITPDRIMLQNCHLMTKHSSLQGDFTLKQTEQLPLLGHKENMLLEATLHQTALSSIELRKFSDFFKGADTLYRLNGLVSLTPHDMAWKNCKLVFGASDSYIESTGCYNGVDATLCIKKGKVYVSDLQKQMPVYFNTLQYIGLNNATFVGNSQKATLTGHIATHIGAMETDLTLHHLGKAIQRVTGSLTLDKVAVAALLPALPIRALSGKVTIQTQGKDFNTVNAVTDLTEIETNHYTYQQIKASCRVANAMVQFTLDSKDPNAKLTLAGRYDITPHNYLQAKGIIEQINLEKLGWVADPFVGSTQFALKIKDLLSERPRGKVSLNQCIIQKLNKKVTCPQLVLHGHQHGKEDLLTLTSSLIEGRLQGKFTLKDLVNHTKYLIARLKNSGDLAEIPGAKLHLDYTIHCKKIETILNWFSNHLYISDATTFSGHFAYNTDYDFSLELPTASTFSFKQFSLTNSKIKLHIGHLMDVKKRLVQLSIASDKQDWHSIVQTAHLDLQFRMDKDTFTFSNKLVHQHSHLSIACSGTLRDGGIEIELLPSRLTTKGQIWTIQAKRPSFISKTAIAIGGLSITSGQASICIDGSLTPSAATTPLYCTIHQFPLDYTSAVGPIKGIIEAKLVAKKNQLIPTGSLRIEKVTIQNYAVGTLKIDWNVLENTLGLAAILEKADQRLLEIKGDYDLAHPSNNLAITTTFNQMDLQLLNPLFASACSAIQGKLSGQFQLTGQLSAPKINGKGWIDQGQFTINYLNTSCQTSGPIKIRENRLYLNQLDFRDGASGRMSLSGYVALQNGFPLMFGGRMETFHLLHTTRTHNPDFYGDLYATGTLQMEGSIYDLLVKIKATTDQGDFTIVAHDKENIENTTKLVQFIYKEEKKQTDQPSQSEDDTMIKLILDLNIQPTVKVQVLFGSNVNMSDRLQGQGTGAIQLEVGTNRKPYVMGNYLFQSGTYTVSVYNLIQKTFTITPNSQVNFNGYPQEGMVHLEASYTQMASVTALYPQSNDKRPIPVTISLSAYGKLTHPHIAYQLLFPVKSMDFELNTALEACAAKALLDKHYLNRQILSLIIAKRIYDEQKIDGWAALNNSINDLLSQRIQDMASKMIHPNLAIETDLGIHQLEHHDQNILQRTKIKVSYLLLSEDLKLSSTVGQYSCFINDWEISYRISKVYNMHAKFYQQPLQTGSTNLALFGISFGYVKKFW